jgi:hypothetical protein
VATTKKKHRKNLYAMRCPKTGKLGYDYRAEAREARRVSRRFNGEKTSEWSVYRCPHCDYWHIGHNNKYRQYQEERYNDELQGPPEAV